MGEGDDHTDAGERLGKGSRPSGQGNDSQKEEDEQARPAPPDPDAPCAARILRHCELPTRNSMRTRVSSTLPIRPKASVIFGRTPPADLSKDLLRRSRQPAS